MSQDCVSDAASIQLYCSDIECSQNTCYAAVSAVPTNGGAHHHSATSSAQQLGTSQDHEHHYDEPQVFLDTTKQTTMNYYHTQ